MVCDSFESPRKVFVWDLEANTASTVATLKEANWPAPETGRTSLHTHFTPDGTTPQPLPESSCPSQSAQVSLPELSCLNQFA